MLLLTLAFVPLHTGSELSLACATELPSASAVAKPPGELTVAWASPPFFAVADALPVRP